MQTPPLAPTHKKRFGLIRVRVDSNHVIRVGEGKGARRVVANARDRAWFPDAKTRVVCAYCRDRGGAASFADEAALRGAHETQAVLERNEETHLYYWWSDDPDPHRLKELESDAAYAARSETDRAMLRAALPVIGMLTQADE